MRLFQTLAAVAVAGALFGCSSEEETVALPKVGAKLEETSVSGLSAGAYMAGQFHIAHSDIVNGAGLIAGGPYGCGQSEFTKTMSGPGVSFINMSKAINGCMKNNLRLAGVPNVSRLAKTARDLSYNDAIAPLQNLKTHKIYLYSAQADTTVVNDIVSAARDFYEEIQIPSDHITFLYNQSGAHAFITDTAGSPCGASGTPYINACEYDQAGAVLKHIRGPLEPASAVNTERFLFIDQRPFTSGIENHSMAKSGAAYVPERCATGDACQVHVVFHGCGQSDTENFGKVVRTTGYAEWAEANNLVVLFPRATVSAANPAACWDWWGYTGPDYLTRKAPQIRTVRRMLNHLAADPN